MFLRSKRRIKDGKEHRYWNIVENKRCSGGKVVQRQVLYLGEINDSQRADWCRQIEAFDEGGQRHHQLTLFAADRAVPDHAQAHGVQVRLAAMALHRPRQWGACWLACELYEQLELNEFWQTRLPDSREGTCWRDILQTLVCYRLIDPGSEWRLHRQWFEQSAMGDLLGRDYALVEKNALYRCLDKLRPHKQALFSHLRQRWTDLFGAKPQDGELYVLAQSRARIHKERAMRRRQLKWLWARLKDIAAMTIDREELPMKLGAARAKARAAWRLIDIDVAPNAATFGFALNRNKLRAMRRREGRYLLRSNLCGQDPAELWQFYIALVEIEAVFKTMKDDLDLRPIYHQLEERIEAHIFVAFLAYCLHVTLRARLKPLAPGLTPRAVLDKLAAVPMLDVQFPTTDGRTLIMSRYTALNADQKLPVKQLKLNLPPQPRPASPPPPHQHRQPPPCSGDFR
jgi:hypothetical protein